ncbi:MAG TPA: hypothetical protein VGS28_04845 [Candidatus Saccharimonadales bacterium]|nr:hypothetical protein [Candidatus Saccharimonadales bacterium]
MSGSVKIFFFVCAIALCFVWPVKICTSSSNPSYPYQSTRATNVSCATTWFGSTKIIGGTDQFVPGGSKWAYTWPFLISLALTGVYWMVTNKNRYN